MIQPNTTQMFAGFPSASHWSASPKGEVFGLFLFCYIPHTQISPWHTVDSQYMRAGGMNSWRDESLHWVLGKNLTKELDVDWSRVEG